MTTLTPGTRLGAFDILATLGEGGMGAVYRARDRQLNRDVAIKVLLPAIADDLNRLARFEREAQVLASLNHPNIAAIFGVETLGGTRALVLEMVEGQTLAERIDQGPIALDESLAIARQIADALGAAHDQGIVHRDLKPANVKLRPDGTVKVLDFGLAKAMDPATAASAGSATMSPTLSVHATMAGVILGTAAYMSPEQASGKAVDKRADIWAFGVVLWEMVTGRRMFEGETVSHVLAAVLTSAPDIPAAPLRVRRLLERCLEKDPRRRLRDIGDAMSLADDVTGHEPVAARRGWPVAMAWTVAGALAVALAVAVWLRPASAAAGDPPAVRLQIERTSVDPYNNATLAFAVSPDGRFLAHYTMGANGQAMLSVQTLATGERREVPGSAALSPSAPFWSPDSRQVVFGTNVTSVVYDVVTGTTRELCACRIQGGSWNADGVILLGSLVGQGIRRLSLTEREPVAVTTPGSGERDSWPLFLPDGRRFVFTRAARGAVPATYLGTLDGGQAMRLTDGSRTMLATLPGDRGQRLLGIDAVGLVAQAVDLDALTASEPVVVVAGAAAASVSTNGVLATSVASGRPVTVPTWFDRQGTPLGTVGAPGGIQGAALAPDGRTIAGDESRERGSRIWLRDAAGTERRLNPEGGDAPVWSPDGTRLVVAAQEDGVVNMFERAADGSGHEVRLFRAERNAFANDWSRDGKWIVFTLPKRDLDLDLWAIRMDASGDRAPEPYVTGPERETQAEFSPDGRFVAYTAVAGGDPEVYVQPFPNAAGGKWLVSTRGGSEPHWSRDGKELFYIAGQTLMSVPVTLQPTFSSGTPARLFDAPVQPWYINDTDRSQVAPDGKRFLLLVPAGKPSAPPIDVIVNWPTLLKP